VSSAANSKLRRFFALRSREQLLLAEAWSRLLAAALCLRLAPRRTLARALRDDSDRGAPAGAEHSDAERPTAEPSIAEDSAGELARAVARAAAHHLRPMTCLPRALALRQMLAKRGIPSALRIGVRKEAATIAAHAWIEVEGVAIGEPAAIEERFRALLPAPPAARPRG
jgi:hypothetical protein